MRGRSSSGRRGGRAKGRPLGFTFSTAVGGLSLTGGTPRLGGLRPPLAALEVLRCAAAPVRCPPASFAPGATKGRNTNLCDRGNRNVTWINFL